MGDIIDMDTFVYCNHLLKDVKGLREISRRMTLLVSKTLVVSEPEFRGDSVTVME